MKKNALITQIYKNQKANSLRRGHSHPTYSKQELKDWLFSQPLFHTLYDNWKRLDWQSEYVPSIDRLEDDIGYTMANIQLMTWGENHKKYFADVKAGRNTKVCKAVLQHSLDGEFIAEFHSATSASQLNNISRGHISDVCRGDRCQAGGYRWTYK